MLRRLFGPLLLLALAGCASVPDVVGPPDPDDQPIPPPIVLDDELASGADGITYGVFYSRLGNESWVAHHNSDKHFVQATVVRPDGPLVARLPVSEAARHFDAAVHQGKLLFAYETDHIVHVGTWNGIEWTDVALPTVPMALRTGSLRIAANDEVAILSYHGIGAGGLMQQVVDLTNYQEGTVPLARQFPATGLSLQFGLTVMGDRFQLLYASKANELSFIDATFLEAFPQVVYSSADTIGLSGVEAAFLFQNPLSRELDAFRYTIPLLGNGPGNFLEVERATPGVWAWEPLGIKLTSSITDAFNFGNDTMLLADDREMYNLSSTKTMPQLACDVLLPDSLEGEFLVTKPGAVPRLELRKENLWSSDCVAPGTG